MNGLLMYTSPTICFAVNTLSQYMTQPRQVHIVVAKHVMNYLKGTVDYGLWFSVDCEFKLQGFTDSDWAGNVKDRKSTSGCCFNLGSTVIWFSRKQTSVALSTTEAEYIVACSTCTEAVWPQKLLSCLFDVAMDPTGIWCDNQSCIKLLENPVFHEKSKHIEVRYHDQCFKNRNRTRNRSRVNSKSVMNRSYRFFKKCIKYLNFNKKKYF